MASNVLRSLARYLAFGRFPAGMEYFGGGGIVASMIASIVMFRLVFLLVDPRRRAGCLGMEEMVAVLRISVHPWRLPRYQRRRWRLIHPRSSVCRLSWVVSNDRCQSFDGGDVLPFVFGRGWHNLLERLEEVRGRHN